MLHTDTSENINWYTESHEAIKKNPSAMELFSVLNQNIDETKKIIKEKISSHWARSFILTNIWFFATVNPDIAKKLIENVKEWDIESFVFTSYQNIFDCLEKRKTHLLIEWEWTLANPGKQQIDDAIKKLHMLEKTLNPNNITWEDAPTVPAWLVPKEWIDVEQ